MLVDRLRGAAVVPLPDGISERWEVAETMETRGSEESRIGEVSRKRGNTHSHTITHTRSFMQGNRSPGSSESRSKERDGFNVMRNVY